MGSWATKISLLTELFGCAFGNGININGVVAEIRRAGGNGCAATALRFGEVWRTVPRVTRSPRRGAAKAGASHPSALGDSPVGAGDINSVRTTRRLTATLSPALWANRWKNSAERSND